MFLSYEVVRLQYVFFCAKSTPLLCFISILPTFRGEIKTFSPTLKLWEKEWKEWNATREKKYYEQHYRTAHILLQCIWPVAYILTIIRFRCFSASDHHPVSACIIISWTISNRVHSTIRFAPPVHRRQRAEEKRKTHIQYILFSVRACMIAFDAVHSKRFGQKKRRHLFCSAKFNRS